MADQVEKPRTSRHQTPLVGWHPPADLAAWLDQEVEKRGGGRGVKSAILTEAMNLLAYRQSIFSVVDDLALPDDLADWLTAEAEKRGGANARVAVVAEALALLRERVA
jgi:hypothetical protein